MRFGEMQRAIPQATAKMLTQQLKELEADGIISRKLYPVVPPKTEYSLTEQGQTLVPIVNMMSEWGMDISCAWGWRIQARRRSVFLGGRKTANYLHDNVFGSSPKPIDMKLLT